MIVGPMSSSEFLTSLKRSHYCGDPRASDIGNTVVLMGWVATRRDHGGRVFIDLRDRTGITQVVFGPDLDPSAHALAGELRSEFCIGVISGHVPVASLEMQDHTRCYEEVYRGDERQTKGFGQYARDIGGGPGEGCKRGNLKRKLAHFALMQAEKY